MLWNYGSPFIVIDVESNGLYGQPFCVGAVLMDPGGRVLSDFISRCHLDQVPDEIVEEKIGPALDAAGIREDVDALADLNEKFLKWHMQHTKVIHPPQIWADVSFPVDAGFLRQMHTPQDGTVDMDAKRGWTPPYPLLDVSTLIAATGTDPLVNREEYARDLIGVRHGEKHDPRWDAELSGLCVITAQRILRDS